MARFSVQLGTIAMDGPVELFPDPASVFVAWTSELAARLVPLARFDLALLGEEGVTGTGVFLYTDDAACTSLEWTMQDGRIAELGPSWRALRPLRDVRSREARARAAGGTHARLSRHEVELPALSALGESTWVLAFEKALREDGAKDPLRRLRLGGHPCYVQSDAYVDDETFVTAELPTAPLGLEPKYLYLFGEGGSFSQLVQMT